MRPFRERLASSNCLVRRWRSPCSKKAVPASSASAPPPLWFVSHPADKGVPPPPTTTVLPFPESMTTPIPKRPLHPMPPDEAGGRGGDVGVAGAGVPARATRTPHPKATARRPSARINRAPIPDQNPDQIPDQIQDEAAEGARTATVQIANAPTADVLTAMAGGGGAAGETARADPPIPPLRSSSKPSISSRTPNSSPMRTPPRWP